MVRRYLRRPLDPLLTSPILIGRQAAHATRTRAPAGEIRRHWPPGHNLLGVEDQHPPRHQGQHCWPHALAFLHVTRSERAHGQGARSAYSRDGPACRSAAATRRRDCSAAGRAGRSRSMSGWEEEREETYLNRQRSRGAVPRHAEDRAKTTSKSVLSRHRDSPTNFKSCANLARGRLIWLPRKMATGPERTRRGALTGSIDQGYHIICIPRNSGPSPPVVIRRLGRTSEQCQVKTTIPLAQSSASVTIPPIFIYSSSSSSRACLRRPLRRAEPSFSSISPASSAAVSPPIAFSPFCT